MLQTIPPQRKILTTAIDQLIYESRQKLERLHYNYPYLFDDLFIRVRYWREVLTFYGMNKQDLETITKIASVKNSQIIGMYCTLHNPKIDPAIIPSDLIDVYLDNEEIIRQAVIFLLHGSYFETKKLEQFLGKSLLPNTEVEEQQIMEHRNKEWASKLTTKLGYKKN